jgi:hypothetical protein
MVLMQNDRDFMEVVHLHITLSELQERFIIYFPNSRLQKKKYIYIYIFTCSVDGNRVKMDYTHQVTYAYEQW